MPAVTVDLGGSDNADFDAGVPNEFAQTGLTASRLSRI
jgi:hypothetical protein